MGQKWFKKNISYFVFSNVTFSPKIIYIHKNSKTNSFAYTKKESFLRGGVEKAP